MIPKNLASTSAPTVPIPQGVEMIIEACDEWKIQEIGYDGVEKYIKPETFTDHVGKLASKVEWAKIIGSDAVYDNAQFVVEDNYDDENVAKASGNPEKPDDLIMPEVGPWNVVAKQLHESLQQLNVLLDDLNIAKSTDYMKPLTILDPVTNFDPAIDLVQHGKGSQWIWKRRALQEAGHIIENAGKQRQKAIKMVGLSEEYVNFVNRSNFFEELKAMRDTWRVRKVGDHIVGDLSYHIFGTKYEPNMIFDITRHTGVLKKSNSKTRSNDELIEPEPMELGESSTTFTNRQCSEKEMNRPLAIAVSVPKDLARRSVLAVTIVKDEVQSGNLFGNLEDDQYLGVNVDEEKIKAIHWQYSLKWAQNTLLCRDTFDLLCQDAIKLRNRLSIIRDKVLLISLFDGFMLRVELKLYPFEEGEIKSTGDEYLSRMLRELVVGFECTKFLRPQMFVTMPVTHLPEALDLRGSNAFSAAEIERKSLKPKSILERMLEISQHYQLVQMTNQVAEKFALNYTDPVVLHRWVHSGRKSSRLVVYLHSRDYEPAVGSMRTAFFVDISADEVIIETKEGIQMNCQRDRAQVEYSFKYCICTYLVSIVSALSRNHWSTPYHTMHANIHGVDARGFPAPNLIICNQSASKAVLFIFHIDGPPEIKIRKFLVNEKTSLLEEHKWRKINIEKLVGSTLCRKVDILLSFLREAN